MAYAVQALTHNQTYPERPPGADLHPKKVNNLGPMAPRPRTLLRLLRPPRLGERQLGPRLGEVLLGLREACLGAVGALLLLRPGLLDLVDGRALGVQDVDRVARGAVDELLGPARRAPILRERRRSSAALRFVASQTPAT